MVGISTNAFFGSWLIVPVTPEIIACVAVKLKQNWSEELKKQ